MPVVVFLTPGRFWTIVMGIYDGFFAGFYCCDLLLGPGQVE